MVRQRRQTQRSGQTQQGRQTRQGAVAQFAEPPQPTHPAREAARRVGAGMRACDELLAAIALAAHAYHLQVEWCDEDALDERAVALAPWVATRLRDGALATAYRVTLVLGDPVRRIIYLSRRVLRLLSLRARRPAVIIPLAPKDPTTPRLLTGPVAQLARFQADALLAVAARMALPALPFAPDVCYVVSAPRSIAQAAQIASTGALGQVLTLPRARVDEGVPGMPDTLMELAPYATSPAASIVLPEPIIPAAPAASGDSGPLTWPALASMPPQHTPRR